MVDKIGAAETAADLESKNTEIFIQAEVSNILTVSPHCYNAFKNDYEGLKDVEVTHYTELLDDLIAKGALTPSGRIEKKVTYHDPCYLGRHNSIYEPPRRILTAIPGLQLVELVNNRERSYCCGGGGGGLCKEDTGNGEFGEIRIQEALESGAEIITSACPYCIRMLSDAVRELGVEKRIEVRDVADMLWQSVHS